MISEKNPLSFIPSISTSQFMYCSCTNAPNLAEVQARKCPSQNQPWVLFRTRVSDNKQIRSVFVRWADFSLQCTERLGLNTCYKNQILWCFIQLLNRRLGFRLSLRDSKCVSIYQQGKMNNVLFKPSNCRLYLTSWHPSSVVPTVTEQYHLKGRMKSICCCLGCGCIMKRCVIWPSTSDKDFYFILPNMHISHRYSRQHVFVCLCGYFWMRVPHCIDHVLTCLMTVIAWFVFFVLVIIITIIYWHYSCMIIAEMLPGNVLSLFYGW